ncbi:NAD(P)-binding protein [Punctularia strigosozonata HHB-11173 SS5]|uniref:NAD(P)-binding protein n=1 Tax=Punctularia strigosozonata (strain HHB-11173) TaxID=741275 RepID=R7S401_PUNST|nr:NAD(P)-binding protein [Punctularia strigosozonata HHB-11173 SS5]EIN04527.1 NAD(P)-binding protein [Punctularia strigosozonata HHB-11173 SS5]
MPSLSEARAYNASVLSKVPTVPVALFVGGTSGIGQGTAEAFARYTNGNAHIIICGRNREAAERIIASFPKPTAAGAKHEFVQCDVSLMRNVRAVTADLISRLPKLNYLVLSTAFVDYKGYQPTEEGLDKKRAVAYFSRWRFTLDLLPLLRQAQDTGEAAKVLFVYGAGQPGRKIESDDDIDPVKAYKRGMGYVRTMGLTFMDTSLEAFVAENPWLTTIHTWPGAVHTPILPQIFPWLPSTIVSFISWLLARSPKDSGEFMLYALLKAEGAGQVLRFGETGEPVQRPDYITTEGQERLWKYTLEAISVR